MPTWGQNNYGGNQRGGGIFQRMMQGMPRNPRGGMGMGGSDQPNHDFMQRNVPLDPWLQRMIQNKGPGYNNRVEQGGGPTWDGGEGWADTDMGMRNYEEKMRRLRGQGLIPQSKGNGGEARLYELLRQMDTRSAPQMNQRVWGGNKPNPKAPTSGRTGGVNPTGNPGAYTMPFTPSNTDQYFKHDLWENIQNEKRKPKWSEMADNETGGPGVGRLAAPDQDTMNRLGLKTMWMDEAESAPMGEGANIEKYAAGNYLDPESAEKYRQERMRNNTARPVSKYFGKDWRPITEQDKYKVLDPKYVKWDDELGWTTHKKNYNPDGDKSWFQKNVGTILPALMGTLIGGPAGTAIGLGTSAVRTLAGEQSWKQLLPQLLTAGLGFSGMMPSGIAGNLVRGGIKYGSSQLMNRGRG